jgi:pimeloyl-ACP methyl ester carboxylesterase
MAENVIISDEFETLSETAAEFGIEFDERPEVRRRTVSTDDGEISAVVWGSDAATALLLHGRAPTQSARSWDAVALDWGISAVAIDTPGHGSSAPRVDRLYTPRAIAGAVAEAIDQLASTPTLLVGVSFGGLTSIAVGALRPELIAGIVLVDVLPWVAPAAVAKAQAVAHAERVAPPLETFASRKAIVDGLVDSSPRSRASLELNVRANTRQAGDRTWAWRFDPGVKTSLPDFDLDGLWSDLSSIRVPVLLVKGGRSPAVADAAVTALRGARPDIEVVHVPQSGHEIHDEFPRELTRIVSEFAASLTSSRATSDSAGKPA